MNVYMHLSVLAYDQVTVCTATKESDWGHLSICISLHFQVVVVVVKSGAWNVKKLIIGEGVWGASPEHFDARKGNGNHICDSSLPPPRHGFINEIKWNFDPPPIWGRFFFMTRLPKLPPPPQLINNDRPLVGTGLTVSCCCQSFRFLFFSLPETTAPWWWFPCSYPLSRDVRIEQCK